jgi:RNA 2',3'-cyclic 3'-phosphodiesterase
MVKNDAHSETTEKPHEHWRLFAAVPVSDDVRELMHSLRAAIEPIGWTVRWVDPDLAHLTVKFFGDTRPEHVGTLESKLAFAAERSSSFALTATGFQLLGPRKQPNVLSLAIDGTPDDAQAMERFKSLVQHVERQTSGVGAGGNQRGFMAHLTLGRFKDREGAPADALTTLASVAVPDVRFDVDRLLLVRSVLSQTGPTYSTIGEWPLTAPEQHEHT